MEVVELSELPDRAVEIVDKAMSGEPVKVVNDDTRLVITGGARDIFPSDDNGEKEEPYKQPSRPGRE